MNHNLQIIKRCMQIGRLFKERETSFLRIPLYLQFISLGNRWRSPQLTEFGKSFLPFIHRGIQLRNDATFPFFPCKPRKSFGFLRCIQRLECEHKDLGQFQVTNESGHPRWSSCRLLESLFRIFGLPIFVVALDWVLYIKAINKQKSITVIAPIDHARLLFVLHHARTAQEAGFDAIEGDKAPVLTMRMRPLDFTVDGVPECPLGQLSFNGRFVMTTFASVDTLFLGKTHGKA